MLWQLRQFVAPAAMCAVVLPVAVLPSWHPAQFVNALNVLWSVFAPAQVAVDLWQLSQTVTLACTGVLG